MTFPLFIWQSKGSTFLADYSSSLLCNLCQIYTVWKIKIFFYFSISLLSLQKKKKERKGIILVANSLNLDNFRPKFCTNLSNSNFNDSEVVFDNGRFSYLWFVDWFHVKSMIDKFFNFPTLTQEKNSTRKICQAIFCLKAILKGSFYLDDCAWTISFLDFEFHQIFKTLSVVQSKVKWCCNFFFKFKKFEESHLLSDESFFIAKT